MTDEEEEDQIEVRDARLVLDIRLMTAMRWLAALFVIAVAIGIGVNRVFTHCICG